MRPFPFLYFVTDHALTGGRAQIDVIRAALQGGVRFIQFRDKLLEEAAFAEAARAVLTVCREYSALCLFNDRVEAAAALGADGVHIGQDDMPVRQARELLGSKAIIGLSTHNERELLAAENEPVDYINLGPLFATATKDHSAYPPLGVKEVLRLSRLTRHAWTTMGGIKSHHFSELKNNGFPTVAMVTEISEAPDVEAHTRELILQWDAIQ
jgi:thiamine-phosphate pyrophosphorylase